MEKVLLIDGDALLYYEAFKEQTFEEAKAGIYKRLEIILKATKANKYSAFLTCSNNFRHNIAKTKKYKSGRSSNKPKLFYELKDFIMNNLGFCIVNGYEADDLVLYYAYNLKNYDCIVCSPDKDVLYQKSGKHFNYQFKKFNNEEDIKLGDFVTVSQDEVDYFKCKQLLTGDSVDAIVGIPKLGSAKADKILKDLKTKEELFDAVVKEYIKHFKFELLAINKLCENMNLLQMVTSDVYVELFNLPKLKEIPLLVKVKNV